MLNQTLAALKELGLVPLPVVNGTKVPSYLKGGKVVHIKWNKYHSEYPSDAQISEWFSESGVGIGSLGNKEYNWIDIDSKCFESQDECDRYFNKLLADHPELKAWSEQTQSGGYRLLVRLNKPKTFTRFKYGEVMGDGQTFCILAPSIGAKGNYVNLSRDIENIPLFNSLEDIGISASKDKEKPKKESSRSVCATAQPKPIETKDTIILEDCISVKNHQFLDNPDIDDRSNALARLYSDLCGWENWLNGKNIAYIGNANEIARYAGAKSGLDDGKIDRILQSVNPDVCIPSLAWQGGDKACFAKIKVDNSFNNWIESRKFTPHKHINSKLLTDADVDLRGKESVAFKSAMGTGKTLWFLDFIRRSGRGSRIIGYRNNLLHQTIARGSEAGLNIYHINDDMDDSMLWRDKDTHLAACINSIHKGISFGETIVVIDEAESVLKHVLDGGTFSNYEQKRAMLNLEQACKRCYMLILMDANLTDKTVAFFDRMSGKKCYKVQNDFKPESQNLTFIQAIDPKTEECVNSRSPMVSMALEDGIKPFIVSDSKEFCHQIYELLKDKKKTLLITSNTQSDPETKAFMRDPSGVQKAENYDCIILSPTGESGISVVSDCFTHKLSFFFGVLGTDSQMQIMNRLRNNIPHYISCPEKSNIKDINRPGGYCGNAINNAIKSRLEDAILLGIDNKIDSAEAIISRALGVGESDFWLAMDVQNLASSNLEKSRLKECLVHELVANGHICSDMNIEKSEVIDNNIKEIKIELLNQEIDLFNDIKCLDEAEMKALEKKELSPLVAKKVLKTKILKDRLPGLEDSPGYGRDFWKQHLSNKKWLSSVENYAKLQNFEAQKKRLELNFNTAFTREFYYYGSLKSAYFLRLWALDEINILAYIQDIEYYKKSPELGLLINKINGDDRIRKYLNIADKVDEKSIVKVFKSLLESIGIKFLKSYQKNDFEGKKQRYYKIDFDDLNSDLNESIRAIIRDKDLKFLEEDALKISWEVDKPAQAETDEFVLELKNSCISAYNKKDIGAYRQKIGEWLDQRIDFPEFESMNKYISSTWERAWSCLSDHVRAWILNEEMAVA
jgi:hypothetical protein